MAIFKGVIHCLFATIIVALGPKFDEDITLFFIPYTSIEPRPDQTFEECA